MSMVIVTLLTAMVLLVSGCRSYHFEGFVQNENNKIFRIETYAASRKLGMASHAPWPIIRTTSTGLVVKNISDGKEVYRFHGLSYQVITRLYALDENRIICNIDQLPYVDTHMAVWYLRTGEFKMLPSMGSWGYGNISGLSPDGRWVAACRGRKLILMDLETQDKQELPLKEYGCNTPQFSRASDYLGYIDIDTGEIVTRQLYGDKEIRIPIDGDADLNKYTRLAWSPSGKYIATIADKRDYACHELKIWNIDERKVINSFNDFLMYYPLYVPLWVRNPSRIILPELSSIKGESEILVREYMLNYE